jgi:ADP-heptose:LPS heptosyltransferase
MRKLILSNYQSPGDIVMLTAAVRDLHRKYPGNFLTDVRTPCAHLWENNPYITALNPSEPGVESVDCQYPLIERSNCEPWHFLHGFIDFLNRRLDLQIALTQFRGDIHISAAEKSWMSQVQEITGDAIPFWIVSAGGKFDYTIKWWETARYQKVVDHFRGRVLFVQIGEQGHHHPPLRGVIDLRGKTDLRQLIRLVYHAQGVLGPVSLPMHLAAAIETRAGMPKNRPCVVIAGGREPPHWEAYPHHQFVHTVGALRCCDNGGCWKSRTVPLGDGDPKDDPGSLCVDVVGALPRCMDMVTAEEVIRRIESYFIGGAIDYLTTAQSAALYRVTMLAASIGTQVQSGLMNGGAGPRDDIRPIPSLENPDDSAGQMLTIPPQRLGAFSQVELRNFEEWMLVHLKNFFPAQCAAAGDQGVREMMRHGIERARVYGIESRADVCKYIDLMTVFGRDFDTHKQHRWARETLKRRGTSGAKMKSLLRAAKLRLGKPVVRLS